MSVIARALACTVKCVNSFARHQHLFHTVEMLPTDAIFIPLTEIEVFCCILLPCPRHNKFDQKCSHLLSWLL